MPIFEEVTVDAAIQKGLQELALTRDQVTIDVLDQGKKGFIGFGKKNAKVSMEPVKTVQTNETEASDSEKETPSELLEKEPEEVLQKFETEKVPAIDAELEDEQALTQLAMYLTAISKELNAPALVKISREEGLFVFHLDTQKQGILIGKHGKTLNALQYLAQVYIHRIAKNKLSVVLNVGEYREKRQAILERLAERTAEKVKRTGRSVFLEPMPAFERKQIHSVLSKDDQVKTHSEGDDPYRYLIVEPVKKKF